MVSRSSTLRRNPKSLSNSTILWSSHWPRSKPQWNHEGHWINMRPQSFFKTVHPLFFFGQLSYCFVVPDNSEVLLRHKDWSCLSLMQAMSRSGNLQLQNSTCLRYHRHKGYSLANLHVMSIPFPIVSFNSVPCQKKNTTMPPSFCCHWEKRQSL